MRLLAVKNHKLVHSVYTFRIRNLIFYIFDIFSVPWQNIVRMRQTIRQHSDRKICYFFATKAILFFVYVEKLYTTEHHIYIQFEKNKIIYDNIYTTYVLYELH